MRKVTWPRKLFEVVEIDLDILGFRIWDGVKRDVLAVEDKINL